MAAPFFSFAQNIGQEIDFNINFSYDLQGREELTAVLTKITGKLYFYADKEWWQEFTSFQKQSLDVVFHNLAEEFEKKIYPSLTDTFGFESSPGIDGSEKITVLLHPMIAEAGGYFNTGDVYSKFQNPFSNEREMVYLNSRHIEKTDAKYFLAHEFMHLITVNQKDLLRGISEERWLNEARSEYTATFLGYDEIYKGSNLERRVNDFLKDPKVSLTEWLNRKEDYGAVNLFIQYLADHYGIEILIDSLHSNFSGIESINYALAKNNYDKDFSDVFTDWAIALFANDCDLGEKYCYLNKHLQDLRITPVFYYLPKTETVISSFYSTAFWALNWHKFIGGGKNFILEFDGDDRSVFQVPYLICGLKNNCSVGFFSLDGEQKGKIVFPEFSAEYSSLTIFPFSTDKISGFNGKERTIPFSWKVSVEEKTREEREAELRIQLLARIAELQAQIRNLQAQLAASGRNSDFQPISCGVFNNNLYYGIKDSAQVRCLQEFLKKQGPEIYPEGIITGNFLSLTRQAVIRFQEKHAQEILHPLNLQKGTGYVGEKTRTKINQLLR